MEGFIKLHRQLISWEWYDDINVKVVFIHLLLKSNHAPGKWRGIEIQRGETLTGIHILSQEIGLSVQKIRTALKKLKSTNEITIKATNNYSIVKLNNYNNYQDSNTQDNKQATNNKQTNNKQVTTNKNDNNKKNNNNKKEIKHKYGEYLNVLITDKQKEKFIEDFEEDIFYKYIKIVDEYIEVSGKVYKNHNLVMRKFKNNDKDKTGLSTKTKVVNNASDTGVVLAPKGF